MNKINIREFRNNMSKYLNELPIVLTRNGKDIAVLRYASDLKDKSEANVYTNKKDKSNVYTKPPNVCEHGSMIGLCRFGCTK